MAIRFLDQKTKRFHFELESGERDSFVLIFGDEVQTMSGAAPSGPKWQKIRYRGRVGEIESPKLSKARSLEMYFLDVGQGDAAFIVTPNNRKMLVDGGLKDRALGFLIWKYRLDRPNTSVVIDTLVLSHADEDHVIGLIPILQHPKITVRRIVHNGIGVFSSGFDTALGDVEEGALVTSHDTLDDLDGLDLSDGFQDWIDEVRSRNIPYNRVHAGQGFIDLEDPSLEAEIVGPRLEPDQQSLKWFGSKPKTINGHSVVFRLTCGAVRTFFSGDLNTKGAKHLLSQPNADLMFDSHILKSPHHGSHDFHQPMFEAIRPMVTVISSGDSPDHGHPRASFLGGVGLAGRGRTPLVFSTEIAATFSDDKGAAVADDSEAPDSLGDLDFAVASSNSVARRRFKKVLPGIINVRTDGEQIYTARRVMAGYQWEAYPPIKPQIIVSEG